MRNVRTEAEGSPSVSLDLKTCTFLWYHCQLLGQDTDHWCPERNKRKFSFTWRTFRIPIQAWHCTASGPSFRKMQEKGSSHGYRLCGWSLQRLVGRSFHTTLTTANFPSYLVKTIHSYLHTGIFHTSFNLITSTSTSMRSGIAQERLSLPIVIRLYVNHMTTPFNHDELAHFGDSTALVATTSKLPLLVSYLVTFLSFPDRWLWNCSCNIKTQKVRVALF